MERTQTIHPEEGGGRRVTLRLRILYSPSLGLSAARKSYELPVGTTYIRRDPSQAQPHDLSLPTDVSLSRVHARIDVNETKQSVQISDCGSRNGTLVNRVRLAPHSGRLLFDGEVVRVGNTFLLLRYETAEQPDVEIPELVGVAPRMAALRHQLALIAKDQATVLTLGETGTGKEVIAAVLHRLSGRSGAQVSVNCSAIPSELAESQFFGHTAGAFTGAKAHPGFFRAAHKGTLFLDEVGDLPAALQPKLLRVLEDRTVTPVGSVDRQPCDVRVLAATNRNLQHAIHSGSFREDLFARLSDVIVSPPPLRERREDILLLLDHGTGGSIAELTPEVIELLLFYKWPRNVREVFKIASHLRLFGADEALRSRLLNPDLAEAPIAAEAAAEPPPQAQAQRTPPSAVSPAMRKLPLPSRAHLEELLRKHGGVIQEVADELSCSRRQVGRWLEEHGIDRSRYRPQQR